MIKNKFFITALLVCATTLPVCADELSSVEHPKAPAYRVGLSSVPEKQYIEALQEKIKPEKKYTQVDNSQDATIADLTYADLSIKRLSKEVAQELEFEEQDMVADLSLLWQGAAVQSDTINFALYKLANPDADKPDSNSLKKVLTTIASMSTLVGASMSSPVLAGSSLIGGNIIGIMSQDTKALNYKYTKVGDADMIILIRKVEDLQQQAVNLYYDYMSAKKQLEFATKLVEDRQTKFNLAQKNNAPRELVVITDAYYRTALDKQRTAKSEFFAKRAALEQFVGNETFVQFEQELTARENGEKTTKPVADVEQQTTDRTEYNNTIQQVEEFTNSIQPEVEEISTIEEQGVANIAALPDLHKIEQERSREVLTGSSSNVENSNTKKKKSKAKKSKQQEETIDEALPVKKEKVKKDKYSTKGLIFLHNQQSKDFEEAKSTRTPEVSVPVAPAQNKYQRQNSEFNFDPLEEIKAPDLTPGGYSIHNPG